MLHGHALSVVRLAFSPDDGSTILVGSWHGPGEYQYWHVPTLDEIDQVERAGQGWPREERGVTGH